MRIAIHRGRVEPNFFHHIAHQIARIAALGRAVNCQAFGDDLFAGHPGAEAAEWVLEDDLHIFAQRPQITGFQIANVVALKTDRAF